MPDPNQREHPRFHAIPDQHRSEWCVCDRRFGHNSLAKPVARGMSLYTATALSALLNGDLETAQRMAQPREAHWPNVMTPS